MIDNNSPFILFTDVQLGHFVVLCFWVYCFVYRLLMLSDCYTNHFGSNVTYKILKIDLYPFFFFVLKKNFSCFLVIFFYVLYYVYLHFYGSSKLSIFPIVYNKIVFQCFFFCCWNSLYDSYVIVKRQYLIEDIFFSYLTFVLKSNDVLQPFSDW